MIILPPQAIGRGYRQIQLDEPLRSTDEFFSIMHEQARQNPWRVSTYWTSEGKKHNGRVPYRRAVSLRARSGNLRRLIVKTWRWAKEPVTWEDISGAYASNPKTVTQPRWQTWLPSL